MATLLNELKELANLLHAGKEAEFKSEFNRIQKAYTTEEDKNKIADFILNGYKELDEDLQQLDKRISLQEQLEPVKEIVSLSYIAKNYFGKSAAWLQQRIYGYKVRGKVYTLSPKDIETLNFAIQDISKKLGCVVITE